MSDIGHIIRKWRCQRSDHTPIPQAELLLILDAADMGLYLHDEQKNEVYRLNTELDKVIIEATQIKADRTKLRVDYNGERTRIKELGFKDFDELMYWVSEAQLQDIKVKPRES